MKTILLLKLGIVKAALHYLKSLLFFKEEDIDSIGEGLLFPKRLAKLMFEFVSRKVSWTIHLTSSMSIIRYYRTGVCFELFLFPKQILTEYKCL